MTERCEAEFIKIGDRTIFGPIIKVETVDQLTTLTFDTGDTMVLPDDVEIIIFTKG